MFADHIAERVLSLEAALRAARRRHRDLERSRDLWRRAARSTKYCVSCNSRRNHA